MAIEKNQQDVDFIQGMIEHHDAALTMAAKQYFEGKNPEVKKLALDIFVSQSNQIKWMDEWLESAGETRKKKTEMKM